MGILTGVAESDKSGTQKTADTATNTGETEQGLLGQAQETLGNAAQTVKDTLGLSGGSSTSRTFIFRNFDSSGLCTNDFLE